MANNSKWNSKYNQGLFTPKNPDKYIGNVSSIKYRSSWELAFCNYLDNNPKVLKWSSEQPIITYQDLRNKTHRYYPDYYYELKTDDDNFMKKVVVEIKPKSELYPPITPKNQTAKALESHEYKVRTHIKNLLKWSKAIEFCEKRGMEFQIITEDHLRKANLIKS
jgi:hypothetical protein